MKSSLVLCLLLAASCSRTLPLSFQFADDGVDLRGAGVVDMAMSADDLPFVVGDLAGHDLATADQGVTMPDLFKSDLAPALDQAKPSDMTSTVVLKGVGGACAKTENCMPGLECVTQLGEVKFENGYCTKLCNTTSSGTDLCPNGAQCVTVYTIPSPDNPNQTVEKSYCANGCTPGLNPCARANENYECCAPVVTASRVCLPGKAEYCGG